MKVSKVKQETGEIVEEGKQEKVLATPSKKVRIPRAETPTTPREPPKDWESIYELVEELRQDRSAPVDTDGSEALPQRFRGDKTFRFQVLTALMLSSQTKDAIVGETMRALQSHGLDIDNISETSPEALNALIRRVGFHNNKTKYIKETVEILKSQYDGDIPPNATEIMTLPGVGPKMAFIVENVAWNITSGIGVDTHMHRIFNEIKWVSSKNPEHTRKQLQSWLPRDHWSTVNVLWVGFGQEVQQFKPKAIRKALECSRPAEALRLIKRLGVDLKKEGAKMGVEEEIKQAMKG
jgi:endonuclease-3